MSDDHAQRSLERLLTAGGCLAAQYLAAWVMLRAGSREDAEAALQHVCPVGEKAEYVTRAIDAVTPYLPRPAVAA
jgi:hypothetical protein